VELKKKAAADGTATDSGSGTTTLMDLLRQRNADISQLKSVGNWKMFKKLLLLIRDQNLFKYFHKQVKNAFWHKFPLWEKKL
jgi:hypothetical protein